MVVLELAILYDSLSVNLISSTPLLYEARICNLSIPSNLATHLSGLEAMANYVQGTVHSLRLLLVYWLWNPCSDLSGMQAQFEAAMQSKTTMEAEAAATQRRMDSGDCATATGFVSYLGPFNKEFRELLLTRDFQALAQKLNIPASNSLNVTTFLANQSEIGQWNLQVKVLLLFPERRQQRDTFTI